MPLDESEMSTRPLLPFDSSEISTLPDDPSLVRLDLGTDQLALEEFLTFLSYQLRLEARQCLEVELEDDLCEGERHVWTSYQCWANLESKTRLEKWVPFHTCLGEHERFIVRHIYDAKVPHWDEKRSFIVHFIFRAHCCMAMFLAIQKPLLELAEFWIVNPDLGFGPEGIMEKFMIAYKRRTGNPLHTCAYRSFPERILEDDVENQARNICKRSLLLIQLATEAFSLVRRAKEKLETTSCTTDDLFGDISARVKKCPRFGPTWSKMLIVSIDLRYPELKLCQKRCEVGVGAISALRRLLPTGIGPDIQQLEGLVSDLNSEASSMTPAGKTFWRLLKKVEQIASETFDGSLFYESRGLTAATVQVQLCEWRQFFTSTHFDPSMSARAIIEARTSQSVHIDPSMSARPIIEAQTSQIVHVDSSTSARPIIEVQTSQIVGRSGMRQLHATGLRVCVLQDICQDHCLKMSGSADVLLARLRATGSVVFRRPDRHPGIRKHRLVGKRPVEWAQSKFRRKA